MSGSIAEERIREKTVLALRAKFPGCRIIHELDLQNGCRIDIAAVTDDRFIVAEIKSERDTLHRLGPQMVAASKVANEWWLILHNEHEPRLEAARCLKSYPNIRADLVALCDKHRAKIKALDDLQCRATSNSRLMYECVETADLRPGIWGGRWPPEIAPHSRHMLNVLLCFELEMIGARWALDYKKRTSKQWMIAAIREYLTGKQIRQEVCRALRTRSFARADAPIELTAGAAEVAA
jgi:hypothetical protein